ncbi:hypothetical protein AVEN_25952-1 [Araneus ventricosus]|uniref:Uncharacterized protein n=1 Tax=Araneus ventricosus TaxID=182803 RepID=A0A4Y2K9U7_ARAVE|nr:hypothetical protein AVEN_25952-1 [Araneus ventricosus]
MEGLRPPRFPYCGDEDVRWKTLAHLTHSLRVSEDANEGHSRHTVSPLTGGKDVNEGLSVHTVPTHGCGRCERLPSTVSLLGGVKI